MFIFFLETGVCLKRGYGFNVLTSEVHQQTLSLNEFMKVFRIEIWNIIECNTELLGAKRKICPFKFDRALFCKYP